MTGTPKTLTDDECEKLLREVEHRVGSIKQRRKGIRNHCMALLMLDAGLRVGEVVGLCKANLYFLNEPVYQLIVPAHLSHGIENRTIPLTERIRDAVRAMQVSCWSQVLSASSSYAFYQKDPFHQLTTRQVERIIRGAALRALGRPAHPHVLRHTFASRLMRTTNIRIVQELLGHQHMSSTQIYTHPNQEDLKKAIESLDQKQPNKETTAARST